MTPVFHAIINGVPRTKKNHPILVGGKRPRMLPSKQFAAYEKDCLKQLGAYTGQPIDYPVNLCCTYYMDTRRPVDLLNLLSATADILITAGVIADDNRDILAGHDGSQVLYDKTNPRVVISMTEVEGYAQWRKAATT